MTLDDPSPTARDVFQGPEPVQRLSARLAVGLDGDVADADVVAVLGREALPAFRHAQAALRGEVRRTTGEPSFCHSADIALRAADLGYAAPTIQACLLHDTVEDRSRNAQELSLGLRGIEAQFGAQVARDTRLLTNRYSILLGALARHLPADLPFVAASLPVVARALEAELPARGTPERREFEYEYRQLLEYFLPTVDLTGGARRARIDHRYTVLSEIKLQAYRLFVEEMADDARGRTLSGGRGPYENVLVAKSLDLVDNLRTTEVVSWKSLERILLKSEMFLDKTFFLHGVIYEYAQAGSTFVPLYDYLKHHLVEQLAERRGALAFLADSRFAFLVDYLFQQIARLQRKYKVGEAPVEELRRLRDEIRARNGV